LASVLMLAWRCVDAGDRCWCWSLCLGLCLGLGLELFSRPIHHFARTGPRGDVLVFNTARAFNSSVAKGYVQMVDDIRTRGGVAPMVPDVLITAEGTEIYHFDGVPIGDEPYVTRLHVTRLHVTRLHVTRLHVTRLHVTRLHVTRLHVTRLHVTPLYSTPLTSHCSTSRRSTQRLLAPVSDSAVSQTPTIGQTMSAGEPGVWRPPSPGSHPDPPAPAPVPRFVPSFAPSHTTP
jgi:hypothetical protein